MLNFVQYGACLHLSVQNVWGLTFFLDTLYTVYALRKKSNITTEETTEPYTNT